jgi:hypothetical protein
MVNEKAVEYLAMRDAQLDRIETKLDEVLAFKEELSAVVKVLGNGHGIKLVAAMLRGK